MRGFEIEIFHVASKAINDAEGNGKRENFFNEQMLFFDAFTPGATSDGLAKTAGLEHVVGANGSFLREIPGENEGENELRENDKQRPKNIE